ncbi:MAG: cyclic nucleotide-binding domain-containing protein [Deltaproteobacteria bacterium]|nr:cyclic nucleotide-binding domain-containing protein [Deltaproteobacteria bacterium]
MDVKGILTGHELFTLLTPEEVVRLSNVSSEKRFRKGEVIYRKDTLTSHFFVVLSGDVRLALPGAAEGTGFSLGKLAKGELFGLSPVLGFERYTATASAETDVVLLAIEVEPFQALLRANPVAGSAFHGAMVRAYYARYLRLLKALQGIVENLGA